MVELPQWRMAVPHTQFVQALLLALQFHALGEAVGQLTAVTGCEAEGSVVLSSQIKGLSKLIYCLTPLGGLQTSMMAHPTGEVISLFRMSYWPLHI